MVIRFTLAPTDYLEAGERRYFNTYRLVSAAVMLLAISIAFMRTSDRRARIALLLFAAIGALFIFAGYLMNRSLARRGYTATNSSGGKRVQLEVSEAGLRGPDIIESWAEFSRYRETKNLFVLYRGEMIDCILPKRAFTRGEQLVAVRRLLSERIAAHPWRGDRNRFSCT